jgi:adenine-specific DNA-methyltransferase
MTSSGHNIAGSADSAVPDSVPGLSFAELRAELRAQAQAASERLQLTLAESISIAAVQGYWERLTDTMPLRAPPRVTRDLPPALAATARHLGDAMAQLPVAEAAYHLSLLYTSLLLPEWRAKHGVYYTPPSLADRLLDQAEAAGFDWSTAHICDPAAGAAAFLVPATARLMKTIGGCDPAVAIRNISARIRGYEIDPFAAWMGQVFIEATVLPTMALADRRPECITVCDSLTTDTKTRFDLVIGNPPFGRVSLPAKQRDRFARSLYGHANLYGLFTDLAVELASPKGLISLLTPSSFLAGEYFKNLRAVLSREAPPVAIDFVTARRGVFEDVLQETVLATYRKGTRRKGQRRASAAVSFIQPQPGSPVSPEPAGCFTLPRHVCDPWVLPRHADEETLAKRLRSMPERLEDWGYKVSTGPLVWNRHKSQLREESGKGQIPLVWAECVTSDGRFIFRAERRNHQPFFKLTPDDDWLIVRSSCVLLQRTTAKEQARRLIAAEMPASFVAVHGGVTVENHLNMMIPTVAKPPVSQALLAGFLNSAAADRAFRCLSGSVAVSAYELENLPLPSADNLKRLAGQRFDRAAIEAASAQLYGVDDTP